MKSRTLDEQTALLMQGTEYGDASLKEAMAAELRQRLEAAGKEGRPLRVYAGFDPRTSDLHLGHTIPMRKMRQFQELGHDVSFVVGSFTSLIGDPSDKDKLRPRLTRDQIEVNAATYAEQAFRILDPERTRIQYNHTWLAQLSLEDLIPLASHFTLQQFLTRETFRKRWETEDPIYLHETFYALVQAYDAYHLRADVQIGGTDQLFNILTAGRKLMEALGVPPNTGVIVGLLPGTDGVMKMSKSLGNHIPLNTSADDMYGKVMSVPDMAMPTYFRLVTRWDPETIERMEADLAAGRLHPRDAKMRLAREIVEVTWGVEAAVSAEQAFRRVFQEGAEPIEMEETVLPPSASATDALVELGWVDSRSEARRKVDEGAVWLGEHQITSSDAPLDLDPIDFVTFRLGKKKQVRVRRRP
jgi:tyrosyl-tRNA synthetase